jgi:hypothetical protein
MSMAKVKGCLGSVLVDDVAVELVVSAWSVMATR